MKKIVLLGLLVLGFLSIILIVSNKKKGSISFNAKNIDVSKRIYDSITKYVRSSKVHTFKFTPHRLFVYKDSILIIDESGIYISDKDLTYKKALKTPFKNTSPVYYFLPIANGYAALDFTQNSLYYESSGDKKEYSRKEQINNAVWFNNQFYAHLFSLRDTQKVTIESWNPITNETRLIASLNNNIDDKEKSKGCLVDQLQGNFFTINEKRVGFYFYRGNKFLIITPDSIKSINTVVNYPFIKFKTKEVKMSDGSTLFPCEPEKDLYFQMAVCSDSKRIYVLSGVNRKKAITIDVYDNTGFYEKTIELPDIGNGINPSEILVLDEKIYLVCDKNLFMYQY